MERKTLVHLENVSWIRNKKYLLKNLTWKINKGENWILFGPNGSGKTSLLKMLLGYIFPTSGKLYILDGHAGRVNFFDIRKKIGLVSTALESLIHPADLAIEVIISGQDGATRLWHEPSREVLRKAVELSKMLEIKDCLEMEYGLLSQGEKKKILIARALIVEPRLLVLDEPCESLDIGAREDFLKILEKIHEQPNPPSIIHATHRTEEITRIFNNILLLKEGQKFSEGKIQDVLTSGTLSKLFETPLELMEKKQRYFCLAKNI
ncbi:MAG: ABC transporter ATP-binding protein [Promethearchaeota archaeon]